MDYPMEQHEKANSQVGRLRQPMATSGTALSLDLDSEVSRLQSEQPWQAEHTANTLVKYPDLRIVLVALKAGCCLPEHRTVGRLSIQALSGEILVHAHGQTIEMRAGRSLALDHDVSHDVIAKTDSVFLLTIAWPRG